jgi:hypothetical protein
MSAAIASGTNLRTVFAVTPVTARSPGCSGPLPVSQDLDEVDHVERSPSHRASRPERPGQGGMLILP